MKPFAVGEVVMADCGDYDFPVEIIRFWRGEGPPAIPIGARLMAEVRTVNNEPGAEPWVWDTPISHLRHMSPLDILARTAE